MTLDDLRQILDLVREHGLAEFELEQEGVRLRLRKDVGPAVAPAGAVQAPGPAVPGASAVSAAPAALTVTASPPEATSDLAIVTAPLVGTFYRASAPDAPPFVERGTRVQKGQVLCIIEAMKLMNEIESEFDGEIVDIFVENGQPVQYGERLFAVARR